MTSDRELLALQKDVLLARGALERLRIAREVHGLRAAARLPRTVFALAATLAGLGAAVLRRRSRPRTLP